MSLISRINGSFLSKLTVGEEKTQKKDETKSSLSSSSEASFDAVVTDVRPGLAKGAKAFAESLDRLNFAVIRIGDAKNYLEDIRSSVNGLVKLAEQASDKGMSDEDRESLNLTFKAEILKLRENIASANNGQEDSLAMDDLEKALEYATVKVDGTTSLAQTFRSLGGRDGALGSEKVVMDDQSRVDPFSLSISSEQEAKVALEAFTKLKKEVDRDYLGIEKVYSDLRGAALISRAGAIAFDEAIEYAPNVNDAGQVAQMIVQTIRNLAGGASLAEHSRLDTKLASELLV